MVYRFAVLFVGAFIYCQSVVADDTFESVQCESRLIQYSWEQKYGGITQRNSGGKTLFKEAADFMFVAAREGDKECAEAYLLVIEYILTVPGLSSRIRDDNESYLVQKIIEKANDFSAFMSELIGNAPAMNALLNDYNEHLLNKDSLVQEYAQITSSLVMSYCLDDYGSKVQDVDYDTYMESCSRRWQ
ncbi:MAG: hypothetical protein KUG76_06205 [Gammaproteobacteria bacterium]|nr:hypothetical protein [Gammaproteobacteria bacterium]